MGLIIIDDKCVNDDVEGRIEFALAAEDIDFHRVKRDPDDMTRLCITTPERVAARQVVQDMGFTLRR